MTLPPNAPSYEEIDRQLTAKGSPFETEEVEIFGVKQIVWKNQIPTWGDFLSDSLRKFADRPCVSSPVGDPERAIAGDRETVSYREVGERAHKLAGWMLEQGVVAGDPIAIGGINTTNFVVVQGSAQVHCCSLVKCKLVLVDVKTAELIGPLRKELDARGAGPTYCWDSVDLLPPDARAGVKDLSKISVSPKSIEEVKSGRPRKDVHPESDGNIFLTSGMPKGVLLTQRASLHSNSAAAFGPARLAMRMGAPKEAAIALAMAEKPASAILLPVPLFHVTGCMGGLARSFAVGFKLVLMRRWNADAAIELMIKEGVTGSVGVPSVFQAILQSKNLPKDFNLGVVTYGGAQPPDRLAGDVNKAWPEAFMNAAYGMTETTGAHVVINGPDLLRKPHAAGICLPTGQLRVVDQETREDLPPGRMGVILMKGSNCLKEYINNPSATAASLTKDGWLDSGDMGFIDDEGYLVVRDRAKDIIIRGGENIASAEVEHEVYKDDRIAEAAAVPVPHDFFGEVVGLAVSLAPGATATPESILANIKPRVRPQALPVIVEIFDELPRNANAKFVKTEIKKTMAALWEARGGREMPRAKL